MKTLLLLLLVLLFACQNQQPTPTARDSIMKKVSDDSLQLEHELKVIKLAANMQKLRIAQGYNAKEAKACRDSVLVANGIQPN